MTAKTRSIVVEICACLLILLFVYAAVSKLMDYSRYEKAIQNQPFDDRLTLLIAWGVPLIELAIVALLAFPKTKRLGLLGGTLLMSSFSIYIGLVLLKVFGRVPCSCGGLISELGWQDHLYFNLVFVVVGLVGYLLSRKRWPPDGATMVKYAS